MQRRFALAKQKAKEAQEELQAAYLAAGETLIAGLFVGVCDVLLVVVSVVSLVVFCLSCVSRGLVINARVFRMYLYMYVCVCVYVCTVCMCMM